MEFRLITPERVAFETQTTSVTLPTSTGEITILPNHIPLVSQLAPGELIVRGDKEHHFAVSGGFVSIAGDMIDVLAETAEHADEIDEQRAEEARHRAQKMREGAQGEMEVTEAAAALERALTRIKVANRKRRHHTRL